MQETFHETLLINERELDLDFIIEFEVEGRHIKQTFNQPEEYPEIEISDAYIVGKDQNKLSILSDAIMEYAESDTCIDKLWDILNKQAKDKYDEMRSER